MHIHIRHLHTFSLSPSHTHTSYIYIYTCTPTRPCSQARTLSLTLTRTISLSLSLPLPLSLSLLLLLGMKGNPSLSHPLSRMNINGNARAHTCTQHIHTQHPMRARQTRNAHGNDESDDVADSNCVRSRDTSRSFRGSTSLALGHR